MATRRISPRGYDVSHVLEKSYCQGRPFRRVPPGAEKLDKTGPSGRLSGWVGVGVALLLMTNSLPSASSDSSSTSTSLLRRVRANQAEAWARLVDLYGPLVWHWCRQSDLSHVWEWCRDHFRQDYYQYAPRQDPPGPEMLVSGAFNQMRVLRGGGAGFRENESRSATRWFLRPNSARHCIGFRVVVELAESPSD